MSTTRDWDATTYDRVSAPQQRWAAEQLDRLELARRRGRGRRRLRQRQDHARAHPARPPRHRVRRRRGALDGPAHRRRRSATAPPRLCQDLVELDLPEPVDVVFSNATFHWIRDHDALFAALRRNMKPGARLLAQCGGKGNIDRFRVLADEVAFAEPFAAVFRRLGAPVELRHRRGDRRAPGARRVPRCLHVAGGEADAARGPAAVRQHRLPGAPSGPTARRTLRDRFIDSVLERYGTPVVLDYVRLNMTARRA